eukprot:7465179-Ditylum_brightwellii.AAC.1
MPRLSAADAATHAANDLIAALCNPAPAAPFCLLQTEHHDALQKLVEIFNNVTVMTTAPTLALKEPRVSVGEPNNTHNEPNMNHTKEPRVNDSEKGATL